MSKKKKKKSPAKSTGKISAIKPKIKALLDSKPTKKFSQKLIVRRLGFKNSQINREIPQLLNALVKEKQIKELGNGNYASLRIPELLSGTVDHVSSKFGYIITGEAEDVYVRGRDMNYAMHGDKVKVEVFETRHGRKREGKIAEIVERSRANIVGRMELRGSYGFVVPDNKKVHEDIFIPEHLLDGAIHNDKVIVNISVWPTRGKKAEGKVTRVLGPAGVNDAEIHSIMAEYDLPFEFPENVLRESEAINDDIKKAAKGRRDFRNVLTFTIDPEDAKDFDDALSFKALDNGHYEVGVHIADVTYYIKTDSAIEDEAFERATSVYLVDRTIPMLPERLSNGLCSLRPHEDKLTFSAVFEIDDKAEIKNRWVGRTIIHSDRRFTYEDAQECIETGEGDHANELITLNGLAKILKDKRFASGAVNFETTEVKFRLDEEGRPLEVVPKIRKDAHKLIEEFMLLANRSVAEFIYQRKQGKHKDLFVYRVHDDPDPEKVAAFADFAKKFGHSLDARQGGISTSINRLLAEIENKPEGNVLQTLAIRSMAKAVYTTEPKGHFGLAFRHYTHFTSPIRRYPDMMVHRLLQHYLDDGKSPDSEEYEEQCVHSSNMEKRAADAERASIKYKQVEFMASAPDKPYEGIISGVTEWGIYVELVDTKCEGMVRLSDLKGDFFEYDEKNYCVFGASTGKVYTLGDKLTVRIKKTDIDKRIIDLVIEGEGRK